MLIKQYRHRLPIDHDMSNIRNRALKGGPKWDEKAGLGFKAFSMQERNQYSAISNTYSSLYFWLDTRSATEFLWGDGFQNVCDTFGRPSFETWMGVDARRGPSNDAAFLYREDADVSPRQSLTDLKSSEIEWNCDIASRPETVASVVGLDVSNWRRSRFHISGKGPDQHETRMVFQVAYLAQPGLAHFPRSK